MNTPEKNSKPTRALTPIDYFTSGSFSAWCSGGSRIFERGVQVQADYGNCTDCFIMAGEYVYAEL